jgi:RNA polymerase sigma-70 factor (ECF subfamily)
MQGFKSELQIDRFSELSIQEQQSVLTSGFERYYPFAYRLAFGLCNNSTEAEDISQEVFIAVMRGLSSFRGDAKLSTWIYRITTRIAGRHMAGRNRQGSSSQTIEEIQAPDGAEVGVAQREIIHAMNKLALPLRTVLSLVSLVGLSHQEVADIMGVPVGTIWSRLHRARQQLAKSLDHTPSH